MHGAANQAASVSDHRATWEPCARCRQVTSLVCSQNPSGCSSVRDGDHQLVGDDDHLGDSRGDDVATADHVLGVVVCQPGVRRKLRAVMGVVRPLPRDDRVVYLR